MDNGFHFPLFVDLHGKTAVVVGGGAIACRRAGVPFELHLYGDGPHAMGLATAESAWKPEYVDPHAATWHALCVEWLKGLK